MELEKYIKIHKFTYASFGRKIGISRDMCRKIALKITKSIKTDLAIKIINTTNNEVKLEDLVNNKG